MKIMPRTLPRKSGSLGLRKPQKRALLIGIQYEKDEEAGVEDANALRGPHGDVEGMRQLLIDVYSYAPGDIVILVDKKDPGQKQPTRDNILAEIKKLVADARAGDRFFFHYAGHATQVENPSRSSSEEDGLDEYIIPCDGADCMIRDNELRQLLVDPLPIGSSLTAVFDSCHSASLLDLEHYRCNRVYVPWISKGKRRSDTRWNCNMRRRALLPPLMKSPSSTGDQRTQVLARHVIRTSRTGAGSRKTSRDEIIVSASSSQRKLAIRTRSLSTDERWFDTPSQSQTQSPISIRRCGSPESMFPCSGFCTPSSPREARVISIAACKDYQLSWEDFDGSSMTKALIEILKEDAHPTLHALMTILSHRLHQFYLRLHQHAWEFKKKWKERNRRLIALGKPPRVYPLILETDNFQDPQLHSHTRVDKDDVFDP